jgi:hypothetical protein
MYNGALVIPLNTEMPDAMAPNPVLEELERASDSLRKKWTCDLPMNRAVSRRHVS